MIRTLVLACMLISASGRTAVAQSTLDRTPNLSAGWVAPANAIEFHFVHRFNQSGAPQRQVQNRPTFVLGYGAAGWLMPGLTYTTRSALVAGVPNEWEPFLRIRPFAASARLSPVVQLSYNEAARSADGEVSFASRLGAITPIMAVRVLSRDAQLRTTALALAGGAVLRLHDHIALAADAGRRWSDADDDRVFWGAGVQLRIPHSPHTLSLHAANVDALTLQSSSRASGTTRWGFEFTIPITPARYFGGRSAAGDGIGDRVVMSALQFRPAQLRVRAGTRVTWHNDDPVEHSITAADGSWDSGNIAAGATWSRQFDAPGRYEIICTPHPFMKMEVIVE
jgi:plastocyanin